MVRASLLALLALLAGGCIDVIDHGDTVCSADTCEGCCTSNGVCLNGTNVFACGKRGASCDACHPDELCTNGACASTRLDVTPGPEDGGPSGCGPQSCAGCCEAGACLWAAQQSASACGLGGGACVPCTGASTCSQGACVREDRCRLVTSVSVGRIDFGETPVGATTKIDVTFRNLGAAACELSAPAWLPGSDLNAFSFNGQQTYASRIDPGQSSKLTLAFTPYTSAFWNELTDGFTFTANDGAPSECASAAPGCRRVLVTGRGVATALTPTAPVVPGQVSFGEVALGCESGWRQVILVNESSQPLPVTSIATTGLGFELQPMALPATVAPWSTLTAQVRFAPTTLGAAKGELTLVDGVGGTRHFELDALAVNTAVRTETFTQHPGNIADVLFVVGDSSAGMTQVQDELSNALYGFWTDAVMSGASLHAGVVSTDVTLANAGLLQGSPKFVTTGSLTAVDALASNVRLGSGGGLAQALEAARLAVTPPNATDPLRNGGFLRGNARLGLVFVSDSAEKSGGNLDDYLRVLRAAGQAPIYDKVRAYPIVPGASCLSGARYQELVSQLGGMCQSLGAQTLNAQLANVAADLFRTRDEYPLQHAVNHGAPVSMMVDNLQLAPGVHFVLDTTHNSVQFAPTAVPETGQAITVTYSAACHP